MKGNIDPNHDYDEEWFCEVRLGIYDVKSLYAVICFALETWPGSPARPPEEQEWLWAMKERYFAMLMEYNFSENDSVDK